MKDEPRITQDELLELQYDLSCKVTSEQVLRWAKIYQVLQWKWASHAGRKIPRTDQIEAKAYYLISQLEPGYENYYVETAGLRAEYWYEGDRSGGRWLAQITFKENVEVLIPREQSKT